MADNEALSSFPFRRSRTVSVERRRERAESCDRLSCLEGCNWEQAARSTECRAIGIKAIVVMLEEREGAFRRCSARFLVTKVRDSDVTSQSRGMKHDNFLGLTPPNFNL